MSINIIVKIPRTRYILLSKTVKQKKKITLTYKNRVSQLFSFQLLSHISYILYRVTLIFFFWRRERKKPSFIRNQNQSEPIRRVMRSIKQNKQILFIVFTGIRVCIIRVFGFLLFRTLPLMFI